MKLILERINKRFTSSEVYIISTLIILNVILIYCFFIEFSVYTTFLYNLFLIGIFNPQLSLIAPVILMMTFFVDRKVSALWLFLISLMVAIG